MSSNEFYDWETPKVADMRAERDRLREQNASLLAALEAISVKTDNGLQNGAKWAVQALDAIDELARAAIKGAKNA